MDLPNNITNFVANVIERVKQAVYFLMCRLAHEVGGSGGEGGYGFMGIIKYIFQCKIIIKLLISMERLSYGS